MSYEKHNWVNGETITDTLLNHMEDGIASSGGESNVFVVGVSVVDNAVLDKTWEQIKQEVESGKIGFILAEDDGFYIDVITGVYQSDGYKVTALGSNGFEYYVTTFIAQQPSDYPVEEILDLVEPLG